ncbi:MAG: hypothetical protein PHW04_16680 [Candidatus Wallbacteria bacterium]|nr:hypothetical protein [Candidatus Wallbacteria bacterium]
MPCSVMITGKAAGAGKLIVTAAVAKSAIFLISAGAAGAGAAMLKGYLEREGIKSELEKIQKDIKAEICGFEETDRNRLGSWMTDLVSQHSGVIARCTGNAKAGFHEQCFELGHVLEEFSQLRLAVEIGKIEALEAERKVEQAENRFDALLAEAVAEDQSPEFREKLKKFRQARARVSGGQQSRLRIFDGLCRELETAICMRREQQNVAAIRISEKPAAAESPREERIRVIRQEISNFHERLCLLDSSAGETISELVGEARNCGSLERLNLIALETKTKYGRMKDVIAKDRLYRSELSRLLIWLEENGDSGSAAGIRQTLERKFVSEKDLSALNENLSGKLTGNGSLAEIREELLREISDAMSLRTDELLHGQSVEKALESLRDGEAVLLTTDHREYRTMLQVSEKGFSARLARIVGSDEEKKNISAYQRQVDRERAREWNGGDRFLNDLRNRGLVLETHEHAHVEEEKLVYIVEKSRGSQKKSTRESEPKRADGKKV